MRAAAAAAAAAAAGAQRRSSACSSPSSCFQEEATVLDGGTTDLCGESAREYFARVEQVSSGSRREDGLGRFCGMPEDRQRDRPVRKVRL